MAKIVEGNQWVYHPEQGSKLIWAEYLSDHLEGGWFTTPDDFGKKPVTPEPEEVVPKVRSRRKRAK